MVGKALGLSASFCALTFIFLLMSGEDFPLMVARVEHRGFSFVTSQIVKAGCVERLLEKVV
jgi:hypothetical protein